jgi:hypothetical protein
MKKFVSFAVTAVAMVLAFVVAGCNDGGKPVGTTGATGDARPDGIGGTCDILDGCTESPNRLFKGGQAEQTVWKLTNIIDDEIPPFATYLPVSCNFGERCLTVEFLSETTFITYSYTNVFEGTYVADYGKGGINMVTDFGGTKVGKIENWFDWWDVFPEIEKFVLWESELKFYYGGDQKYLLFKPLR